MHRTVFFENVWLVYVGMYCKSVIAEYAANQSAECFADLAKCQLSVVPSPRQRRHLLGIGVSRSIRLIVVRLRKVRIYSALQSKDNVFEERLKLKCCNPKRT